jgi:hypothetical protein
VGRFCNICNELGSYQDVRGSVDNKKFNVNAIYDCSSIKRENFKKMKCLCTVAAVIKEEEAKFNFVIPVLVQTSHCVFYLIPSYSFKCETNSWTNTESWTAGYRVDIVSA